MKASSYPVFLLDDDKLYLSVLEKYLKENLDFTARIYAFSNGLECLKYISMKPKIVVLDHFLNCFSNEAVNGLDILREIKSNSPGTEVIMLSGQDDLSIAGNAMNCGAFDYVAKNEKAFLKVLNIINGINKIIIQDAAVNLNWMSEKRGGLDMRK